MLEETIGADRMELPFAHCHTLISTSRRSHHTVYLSSRPPTPGQRFRRRCRPWPRHTPTMRTGRTLRSRWTARAHPHQRGGVVARGTALPTVVNPYYCAGCSLDHHSPLRPWTPSALTAELGQCDWAGAYMTRFKVCYTRTHTPRLHAMWGVSVPATRRGGRRCLMPERGVHICITTCIAETRLSAITPLATCRSIRA